MQPYPSLGEEGAGGETLRPQFFLRKQRGSFDFSASGEELEDSGRRTSRCPKLLFVPPQAQRLEGNVYRLPPKTFLTPGGSSEFAGTFHTLNHCYSAQSETLGRA